jgi:hypothetical protein
MAHNKTSVAVAPVKDENSKDLVQFATERFEEIESKGSIKIPGQINQVITILRSKKEKELLAACKTSLAMPVTTFTANGNTFRIYSVADAIYENTL